MKAPFLPSFVLLTADSLLKTKSDLRRQERCNETMEEGKTNYERRNTFRQLNIKKNIDRQVFQRNDLA